VKKTAHPFGPKAVTLQDIGQTLNLSRSTVSRALNMSSVVKEETRKKVFETAAALGFRPNRAARSLVMNKERHLAVVVFSEPAYFWRELEAGVQRAANELRDYRIHVSYHAPDIARPEEQIRVLQELVRQGIDGVAISPNDPQVAGPAIDDVIARGIPVLTVSSDLSESGRLCYVGCDYYQAGRIAGTLMCRLIGGKGRLAVLSFSDVVLSIGQRLAGFRDSCRAFPGVDVVETSGLSRTGRETASVVRDLLRRDPGIGGIFVSFGVLEQAGRALQEAGLQGKVVLVGYDLSPEIARLIREEVVDATICQEPFNQGYYPVKILSDYLLENRVPPSRVITTKLEIVMKENLHYYENETSTHAMLFDI
jgi:LacI family transcriptional regulator